METQPTTTSATPPRPRRRGLKIALGALGVVVLALVVGVIFLPSIASALAPGMVTSQAKKYVKGTVTLAKADFSWGGPQQLQTLVWKDEQGKDVARLSLSTDAGLMSLASGSLDLGTVRVRDGSVRVVRARDGTLNVQQLLVPRSAPASQPAPPPQPAPGVITLPKGLKLTLLVDQLDATFTDEAGPALAVPNVELKNVNVAATVDPLRPLKVVVSAKPIAANSVEGNMTVDIAATNWAKPDGTVVLDSLDLASTVVLQRMPTALVDALVGPVAIDEAGNAVSLTQALGPTLDMTLSANGTLQDALAKFTLTTDRADAQGDVRVAQGVLTSQAPIVINVKGDALAQLVPAMSAATNPAATSRIDRVPGARLAVDALTLTLPKGGAPLDLRGAALSANLTLEGMQGSVVLRAGQPAQAMAIAPLTASVQTQDVSQDVRVQVQTSATIAGRPAGDVALTATLSELLTPKGALSPGLKSAKVRGDAAVTQIATAIAQPFVQHLGLDLPRDIGPVLDVRAQAVSSPAAGAMDVTFSASAQSFTANGGVTITGEQIRTADKGVRITASNAGRLAEALTSGNAWTVRSGEGASDLMLDVTKATLVRDAARGIVLEQSSVIASLNTRGLMIANGAAPSVPPLVVDDLTINTTIEQGIVRAVVQGAMQHEGQPFRTRVNLDVPGMLVAGGGIASPTTLRPRGSVSIDNLPTSVLSMVMTPAPQAESTMDTGALLRSAIGPVASIILETKPGENNTLDARGSIQSPQVTVEAAALVSPERIAMQTPLVTQANLTPELFDTLLAQLAPQMQGQRPRLTAPTQARLEVQPLTVPLDSAGKPLLAQAGTLQAVLTIPTSVSFDNVAMGSGRVARVGASGLRAEVQAPLTSLLPAAQGGVAGEGKVTLKANLTTSDQRLGVMDASVRTTLREGKPQGLVENAGEGTLTLASTISQLDTRLAENMLGKPGVLSGALGDTAAIWFDAQGTPASSDAQLTLQAPHVTTSGPLKLRLRPDRIELAEPARIAIDAQPAFLNGLLAGDPPARGGQPATPALTLLQPIAINAYVEKLTLPRGEGGAAPDIGSTMLIPAMALRTSDAKTLNLSAINLNLSTRDAQNAGRIIGFGLVVDDAKVQGAEGSGKLSMTGALRNIVTPQGAFSPGTGVVDIKGRMPAFPTAIADVFAKQDGLLVELLGPMIDVDLDVRSFPLAPQAQGAAGPAGFVDFQGRSPRASARITGDIGAGVLTCSQPISVSMAEVTRALSGRVIKGLPLLGSFEKTPQDAPAVLSGTSVIIPLGSDMTKFNGVFSLDPGEARFGTSGAFSELLNITGLKTGGVIGRRLEPITVTVRNGVATYPKWTLPLGEFSVQTEGTVDLVSRNVDVITWIPLGALSDQAAGRFNTGLGTLLGGATPQLEIASMLPFRTRGPMDNPRTEPDLKLFAETTVKSLSPEKLIEKGLGDLLKGLGRPKEPK